jgi:cyclophilin family peptidyl-prolyl cis-trans isomerase
VDNFLKYVDEDLYQDMFFHRAPPGFVVQGGGFKHTAAGGFAQVPTYPAVVNEPGLTNIRGTVAMAKLGGDPNSATSQFFVNTGNNAANLDAQNGGFTVFGRVADPGMQVIDQIGALPTGNYTVSLPVGDITLTDLPVNVASAPAVLDPAQLVKVSSVTDVPILAYTVTSADPAVATAVISGGEVVITGVAAGSTTVEVKATDLDGLSVTRSIAVTVP